MCRQVQPDLIPLDIMLPDLDGYSVCEQIRQFTFVPIFFLSAKNEDLDKILGLSIGGDDYITKPFSPKEVAYKMKAFFRRNQYKEKNPNMYQFGDITIDEAQGTVLRAGTLLTLTAKEFNILLFLIKTQIKFLVRLDYMKLSGAKHTWGMIILWWYIWDI